MKFNDINFKPSFAFALFLFSSLILSASQSESHSHEHEFNYDEASGRGPSNWGSLKPEWRNCSKGRKQSPINIQKVEVRPPLGELQRNYRSAPAQLKNGTEDVEVEWSGDAGSITINRLVYHVSGCHWHSPAEHTLNGTRYPLELHVVHSTPQNDTAVVAILYRFGLPDPFLWSLSDLLSLLEGGQSTAGPRSINPETIGYPGRRYYRYNGSLTTPPCTEGVVWTVFRQVKTVSRDQVETLQDILPPQNRNNSRPIQPLNDRDVLLYDPIWST